MKTIIEVGSLKTIKGRQLIHDDLSFSIHEKEIFLILGGSGSGKTTLLREIALLDTPAAGFINVFGKDALKLSSKETTHFKTRVAVTFQQGALFTSMTVLENVAFPMQEHTDLPWSIIEELSFFKIAMVGLPSSAAYKLPSELSGGMIKRAALARSLSLDPSLLLLDEPTAGLDPESASEFDELILLLRDSLDLTVVMVTHDLDSIYRLCDRALFLGDGKILDQGDLKHLERSSSKSVYTYFNGSRSRTEKNE